MTRAVGTPEARQLHGRNRITPRAIRAVVSAITAEQLGTPARTVGVELGDGDGALTVTASAPVGVPSLTAVGRRATPGDGRQRTVVERAAAAQTSIRDRVLEFTGSTISIVNLRLTSARIEGEDRVQ